MEVEDRGDTLPYFREREQTVEPLYGSFEHSLDSKGRVIVPAPLRHRFEREQNAAVISYYQEKCLALWPPAEFNRRLETVMAVQDLDPEHRQMARATRGTFLQGRHRHPMADHGPERLQRVGGARHREPGNGGRCP